MFCLVYVMFRFLKALVLVVVVQGSAITKERDLQNHLMLDYNANILPTANDSFPVDVNVRMVIESIFSIDEANEVISSKFYFESRWKDASLMWDPDVFGKSWTMLKQRQIWFPDVIVSNSITEYKLLGFDDLKVTVSNEGEVLWAPGVSTTTICPMHTRLFPFDRQVCVVEIVEWTSALHRVRLTSGNPETTNYTYENGQWEITATSSSVSNSGGHACIRYGLHLKRRSLNYISTVIVPVSFICILNCFTFLIPKQTGERISYSITVFLSFILILTIINGILPKTSKVIPVFVVYLGSLLTIALLTITLSILCLTLEHPRNKDDSSTNLEDYDMKICDTDAVSVVPEGEMKPTEKVEQTAPFSEKKTFGKRLLLTTAKYFESVSFFVICSSTILSTVMTYIILLKPE